MKTWQIFFCELKNGEWRKGTIPVHVIFDKNKAESTLKRVNKHAGLNSKFVMTET